MDVRADAARETQEFSQILSELDQDQDQGPIDVTAQALIVMVPGDGTEILDYACSCRDRGDCDALLGLVSQLAGQVLTLANYCRTCAESSSRVRRQ